MPKITVIVPVYNVEKYLEECLDSIVNQSLIDIEILCINDGSTDNSLSILEEYAKKDCRINVISKTNSGLGATRNYGVKLAKSPYIFFMDSDDWIENRCLETLYNKIVQTGSDICIYGLKEYNQETKLFNYDEYWTTSIYKNRKNDVCNYKDIKSVIFERFGAVLKLYDKDFFIKNELFFKEKVFFEDVFTHVKALLTAKKISFVDEVFYIYRIERAGSIMHRAKNDVKVFDVVVFFEDIYNFLIQNEFLNELEYEFYNFVLTVSLYHRNRIHSKKIRNVFNKECKKIYKKINLPVKLKKYSDLYKIYRKEFTKLNCAFFKHLFSVTNSKDKTHKEVRILGLKFKKSIPLKRKDFQESYKFIESKVNELQYLHNENNKHQKNIFELTDLVCRLYNERYYNSIIDADKIFSNYCVKSKILFENMKYLFDKPEYLQPYTDIKNKPNAAIIWGSASWEPQTETILYAMNQNIPLLKFEDGFLRSADTYCNKKALKKYTDGISFTFSDTVHYFDATRESRMEKLLNDKTLIITDEQKQRARKCIDRIIETHLTKYNHQPIFEPKIGRDGVKKVLVVDQSYGDFSISRGLADENTFKEMLEAAIRENPDADIIVKTHPDTMAGAGGYYKGLVQHDNIYTQTEPINPISLIKYVDKVYVCTTQFGFEALMCGKEVHVFGMPFYAGWGLTHDRQKCERRTNTRTLEEMFYIAYIIYSYYVNPDKQCRCEIEEAMDYLLTLRKEYFEFKGEK